MVLEHAGDYGSQWGAINSIAGKIGCTAETLRRWVRQAERDEGLRPGPRSADQARLRELAGRTGSFGRPTRFCARRLLILPRRSSTAGSSHDRLH